MVRAISRHVVAVLVRQHVLGASGAFVFDWLAGNRDSPRRRVVTGYDGFAPAALNDLIGRREMESQLRQLASVRKIPHEVDVALRCDLVIGVRRRECDGDGCPITGKEKSRRVAASWLNARRSSAHRVLSKNSIPDFAARNLSAASQRPELRARC